MASAATTYNMLMLIKAMSAVPSYTTVRWANVVLHVFSDVVTVDRNCVKDHEFVPNTSGITDSIAA